MKKIFLSALALLSFNAFSQSYIIMDNGITITVDNSGYVYDFGHYAYPQKVTLKGGQYFVEDGNILATVDEKGLLFRKYELIPEKIKGKGINYFLSDEGTLYTVNKAGIVTITQNELFQKALNFGGNYFTVPADPDFATVDFYVVTSEGTVVKADIPSMTLKEIVAFGGTYIMNNRGVVTTISSTGVMTSYPQMRIGVLSKRGGNYFSDSNGFFYSIGEDGSLKAPGLPVTLRVPAILKLGSNYFVDQTGKLFVVDKSGNVFERVMRDHDFKNAKVISL